MAIRVLIGDDHSVVRQGLLMSMGTDPELEIVGEARDGAEAVKLAHLLRPFLTRQLPAIYLGC